MATAPRHEVSGPTREASSTLVGRESELDALTSALSRQPAVAMIEGEAGVGKSRLVRELLARPALRRLRVMLGRCQSPREPFLYGAVLEALGGLHRPHGPAPLIERSRLSPVTGVLRALLPELSDHLPEAPEPTGDPRSERHRLFRAVRELLSEIGPALLVVEDLHWADDGSRHLLRFLMADLPRDLSIVVTYRREDVPGGVPLGSAYRPPPGAASVLVDLRPLDRGQVRALASAILGRKSISVKFATKLYERTAGIPFVVEETLRALRNSAGAVHLDGATARQLLENVEVPVLLREAMTERLTGMPLAAVRLAQAAAVLNVPSSVELLREVAGLTEQRCHAALASALGNGVLYEVDDYAYGYRHSLARQAVYDTILGYDRKRLHARALRALEGLDPRPLVQMADHSHRAGDAAQALRYGEEAADLAAQVGDVSTTTRLLQRLLGTPGLTARDVDRLAVKLGQVAHTGLDQYDPVATLERLLSDPRLSTAARGEVRLFLGMLLVRQTGRLKAGRAVIETALDELEERPALLARGVSVLAQPFYGTTPLAEILPWRDRLRTLIETSEGEVRLSLQANHLSSLMQTGDPHVLRNLTFLPSSAPLSTGEQRQLARVHCNMADACTGVGHYRRARTLLETGLRLAIDAGTPFVVSTARATQARLNWFLGDWHGLAERAADLLDEYHDLFPVASELSLVLGSLAIVRGDWEEAEERLSATGVRSPHDAITPVIFGGFTALARLRLSQGEDTLALAEIDRALAAVRSKGVWTWTGELVPVAVAVLVAHDRIGEAQKLADELEHGIAAKDAPMAGAALEMARGQLAQARGDLSSALGHYDDARRRYLRLPAPYYEALAAEQAALCRLEAEAAGTEKSSRVPEPAAPPGTPEPPEAVEAAEELSALADRFAEMGATRDADRCRHQLRSHGAVTPSRRGRRGYGDVLSPREEDVARLLARGRTNREIAQVLFLSPRTVEQHVARTLKKLGKRSRTDLLDD
ncbi:helix-turn-helix transcriptional regulator [Streptosporangium carneum]|uniref:LuxR family transcriptional regulator n=1 Tax=Streptosporangium carneum TaxID=47481 RepID=A0A9W6MHH6_9ACTN|nr:LuxR family transcriptional regulator [Streptosporangium carneum]GLK14185.1 LuxR family transcriptional regulator [Streptosporangium carneum]